MYIIDRLWYLLSFIDLHTVNLISSSLVSNIKISAIYKQYKLDRKLLYFTTDSKTNSCTFKTLLKHCYLRLLIILFTILLFSTKFTHSYYPGITYQKIVRQIHALILKCHMLDTVSQRYILHHGTKETHVTI
jgi:hypothetical protein